MLSRHWGGTCQGHLPLFNELQKETLCDNFQFHSGCDAANAPLPGNDLLANRERDVRAVVVPCPEPSCALILCLLYALYDVLAQPFMANRPVETFGICVLLGLSGLDGLVSDLSAPDPVDTPYETDASHCPAAC